MGLSVVERLALLDPDARTAALAELDDDEVDAIADGAWPVIARPEQLPPDDPWFMWMIRAGRGWGKTRTGAETTIDLIGRLVAGGVTQVRWALVGPTRDDVRTTMLEGESGLLTILPPSLLINGSVDDSFNRSSLELTLTNGARLRGYSSERPARLRGPQYHGAWVDEPATFRDADLGLKDDSTLSNLLLGLRLPPTPRLIVTGTPRNNPLVKALRERATVETRGSTYDNLHNLSPEFRTEVVDQYEGTRLGRQELHAEILDDLGNLIHRRWFRLVDDPSPGAVRAVRYWDLAATVPSDRNPDPDWTVGLRLAHNPTTGIWTVEHVDRFRESPGARDALIVERSRLDGLPTIGVEQEGGSGGKAQVSSLGSQLDGICSVRGERPTGSKVARAEGWIAAAEQGRVEVVNGPWVEAMFDEWEEFPNGGHDDVVDAMSGAFNLLAGIAPEPEAVAPAGVPQQSSWRR